MKPKGIIRDFDGPVLDGVDRHYAVYREILEQHGFAPLSRDHYWDLKRNLVNRRAILTMSGAAGLYDVFLQAWLNRIELREYLRLDRLQPGIIEVLRNWRSHRIPVVLATLRNSKANVDWQMQELQLEEYFQGVVVVDSLGQGGEESWKSKAAAVRHHLGPVPMESAVWVGDTEVDMQAAQALGARSCAVLCGLRTEAHLRTFTPDYVFSDVAAFASTLRPYVDGGAGGN